MAEAEGTHGQQHLFAYDILNEPEKDTDPHKTLSLEMFSSLSACRMTTEEYEQKISLLTECQKQVFTEITHPSSKPFHFFIMGGAGTGKPFLLKLIREYLSRSNRYSTPNVLVAAPTGVAAYYVSEMAIHTLLQLPTQDKANAEYRLLSPRSFKILSEAFRHDQYLILMK